jgi:hypothetical protein
MGFGSPGPAGAALAQGDTSRGHPKRQRQWLPPLSRAAWLLVLDQKSSGLSEFLEQVHHPVNHR